MVRVIDVFGNPFEEESQTCLSEILQIATLSALEALVEHSRWANQTVSLLCWPNHTHRRAILFSWSHGDHITNFNIIGPVEQEHVVSM